MAGRGRPSRTSVYQRLDKALAELNQRFGGLPSPKEAQAIWEDIWHQEAHHSTALEGNTLVLRQVQALLDQGRAIGAKPLSEYNEVRGYANAAQWVYGQALEPGDWHDGRLLTIAEVRQIHHTAMTPVWDVAPHPDATDREGPGSFREHDIRPFGGGMTPPSWPLVPAQVQHWVESACITGDKIHAGVRLLNSPGYAVHGLVTASGGPPRPWTPTASLTSASHRSTRQMHRFGGDEVRAASSPPSSMPG